MARSKELCVMVLDVGPLMHHHLPAAGKAVSSYVEAKMLTKPGHEVALVLFGTTGTSNDLNREMKEKGDPDQYSCISLVHALSPPDLSYLTTLHHLPRGKGASDFVNALTVAVDYLYKYLDANKAFQAVNVVKRVLLVSNFLSAAAPDPNDIFIPVLISRMQERGIILDVVSVDIAAEDAKCKTQKDANNFMLTHILAELRHTMVAVRHPLDLLGVFKARDYSHTAYYSGPFTLGDLPGGGRPVITIMVKVCKKSSKEKFPSLSKYSDKQQGPGATHGVSMETEYRSSTDADEVVAPEDRVKAYRYGKQVVPIASDMEAHLKYSPDRGLQLVGFVDLEDVPRQHYMKDTWLIAPEKENLKSITAMSALVRGLQKTNKGAILRFVPRGGGSVFLGWATPLLGGARSPDCLLLNYLPFLEDVRKYEFTSFDAKPDLIPSSDQLQAVEDLVSKMDLTKGETGAKSGSVEHLCPDSSVNPLLQRFYSYMADKALNQDAQVPDQDPLVERTFMPRLNELEGAQEAIQLLAQLFRATKPSAPAAKSVEAASEDRPALLSEGRAAFSLVGPVSSKVDTVGTSTPVQDFNDMLAQDMLDAAFAGLQRAISTLVDTSLGDRAYIKALKALKALRGAAVQHNRWQSFNTFLHELSRQYEHHAQRCHWWRQVMEDKVTLISSQESSQSDISAAAAQDFLVSHTPKQTEAAGEAAAVMEEEEDEFAGMD